MRVIIQRAGIATVKIAGKTTARIKNGLLVLTGFEDQDNEEDVFWLAGKIARLRIFNDENGIMNLSVQDIDGEVMIVSQFTLHAKTKKGNRPSYVHAAAPEKAIPLYNKFIEELQTFLKKDIKTGEFGAIMQVELVNDGPVTIFIDTKNRE